MRKRSDDILIDRLPPDLCNKIVFIVRQSSNFRLLYIIVSVFIVSTLTLLGDSRLPFFVTFHCLCAPGGRFYYVILYFITIVINNEVVLAPKLCVPTVLDTWLGGVAKTFRKKLPPPTPTRPCTQNLRIMFELTKRSIYFCPFYSSIQSRVLDLQRTGFVISHPTLTGDIPNNNLYWKPVSLWVVHSDTNNASNGVL